MTRSHSLLHLKAFKTRSLIRFSSNCDTSSNSSWLGHILYMIGKVRHFLHPVNRSALLSLTRIPEILDEVYGK